MITNVFIVGTLGMLQAWKVVSFHDVLPIYTMIAGHFMGRVTKRKE